ncbi:hypothetical protein DYI25_13910 [Mesobacillus boroniphilus]|uniref:Uncharacterized protein n=1 Tax=Mesobacillus boroniphilus TaxID=308892 RepID=A0A944CPH9_9BACI|nr:hypothetical protein [Mesobacillus boroniphilus]
MEKIEDIFQFAELYLGFAELRWKFEESHFLSRNNPGFSRNPQVEKKSGSKVNCIEDNDVFLMRKRHNFN